MFDLFREIAQTLRHNKLRTALTGFAVAWGIFMLIILLGMSRGVFNSFSSFASAEQSRTLSIWGGWTGKAHHGYKEGRRIILENDDKPRIRHDNPHYVENVFATKEIDSAQVSTNRDYISNPVYGHYPEEIKRAKLNMLYGRFLNQRDLDETRKVIVIQRQNAKTLFGDETKAVGSRVQALGLSWLVIGVYDHDWESGSYVPFTTAMMLSGNDGKVSQLMVSLKNVENMDDGTEAEAGVRKSLSASHDFASDDTGAVHIWNRFNSYLSNMTALNILDIAVWIIGIFTLLSGIVGISNIMFVSVRERTHEIGIRRAIGAKPRSILIQIVTESVAITTIFGYIGIVLGTMVTALIAKITADADFLKDPTVNISIAIKVTLVLIIAGALAGLFPALKATKVKPVEALRDE